MLELFISSCAGEKQGRYLHRVRATCAPMAAASLHASSCTPALRQAPEWLQAEGKAGVAEKRRAYMHWVVRDPRAGGWLKSEFEIMGLLDATGDMFRSHVHVTGQRMPVGLPAHARPRVTLLRPAKAMSGTLEPMTRKGRL